MPVVRGRIGAMSGHLPIHFGNPPIFEKQTSKTDDTIAKKETIDRVVRGLLPVFAEFRVFC